MHRGKGITLRVRKRVVLSMFVRRIKKDFLELKRYLMRIADKLNGTETI